MTLYYLKQDDTVWGCGESDCCGEYYEQISESFVECNCEVEVDAEHLHGCNGGGPVLEWRKAYALEAEAYEDGKSEGWSDGADWGEKYQKEHIIKLLEGLKGPEIACCDDCRPYAERSANYLDAVIALIKGENK